MGMLSLLLTILKIVPPPGRIVVDTCLREGYIKANGSRCLISDYPRIFNYIIKNKNYVSEEEWINYPGLYGYDEGSDSFLLPDLRGYFIRNYDDNRGIDSDNTRLLGSIQEDAIRNITGSAETGKSGYCNNVVFFNTNGVFGEPNSTGGGGNHGDWIRSIPSHRGDVSFDASRVVPTANENRVKNIVLLAQIRY